MLGKPAEEEELVFGEDYEDLQKSLEQARKLALRKQEEAAASSPLAAGELATASKGQGDADAAEGDTLQNKKHANQKQKMCLWMKMTMPCLQVEEEEVKLDEVVHEVAVGKGLAGASTSCCWVPTLLSTSSYCGRTRRASPSIGSPSTMRRGSNTWTSPSTPTPTTSDPKHQMTPKESFRDPSHKFHGKGPGKMQEKRQKKYQDELKAKRMKSSDMPLLPAEKMRGAQAGSPTPYLVLSGKAKSGPTGDASGFLPWRKSILGV